MQKPHKIITLKRAEKARKLMTFLYSKPVVNVGEIEQFLKISFPTANQLLKDLERMNVLAEYTGKSRYRHFVFKNYIDLFLD